MIRSELVQRLAARSALEDRKVSAQVVDTILEVVSLALARGDRVELRGFGAFSLKTRGSQIGRDPRNGAAVALGERRFVYFRASKALHELLNAPEPSSARD